MTQAFIIHCHGSVVNTPTKCRRYFCYFRKQRHSDTGPHAIIMVHSCSRPLLLPRYHSEDEDTVCVCVCRCVHVILLNVQVFIKAFGALPVPQVAASRYFLRPLLLLLPFELERLAKKRMRKKNPCNAFIQSFFMFFVFFFLIV